jgi:hypothetical protein
MSCAPRLFLLLCAPVVVDLLFGATQASSIVALVPETLTYGCAALLVRGLARHRDAGWVTVIIWGVAFAVLAECLIVQTSLAPLTGPHAGWGRALGVNWPYLVWATGYESCWAIALPIQLTDLLFPAHRESPWPGRRGRLILAIVFVLGAIATWYNWTRITAPALTHQPPYQPPLLVLFIALTVAIGLGVLGTLLPRRRLRTSSRAPGPVFVGAAVSLAAALWFALLVPEVDSGIAAIPAVFPIGAALLVAVAIGILLRRWSGTPGWTDRHRLAVVIGALTASMAAGFVANRFGAVDLMVKAGLDVAALVGLAVRYRFFTVAA